MCLHSEHCLCGSGPLQGGQVQVQVPARAQRSLRQLEEREVDWHDCGAEVPAGRHGRHRHVHHLHQAAGRRLHHALHEYRSLKGTVSRNFRAIKKIRKIVLACSQGAQKEFVRPNKKGGGKSRDTVPLNAVNLSAEQCSSLLKLWESTSR